MNTDILLKAKDETLEATKQEAELNLEGILRAEEVITDKSNTLIQVLIPVFLVVLGFLLNSLNKDNLPDLFYLGIPLSILLGLVICMLYSNILPVKSAISGSEPNQILQLDIVDGKNEYRNFLIHRIWSLQKAIEKTLESHKTRYDKFRSTILVLFTGLGVILFGVMILLSFRLFPLFQCK